MNTMIVRFDLTKRIEAKVDDKYKVLFDETEMSGWEWEKMYQQLCMDLAEQFDIDEDDYIENVEYKGGIISV